MPFRHTSVPPLPCHNLALAQPRLVLPRPRPILAPASPDLRGPASPDLRTDLSQAIFLQHFGLSMSKRAKEKFALHPKYMVTSREYAKGYI